MDYNIQQTLEENEKSRQGGAPIKLTVEHILGALFILLIGNSIATIFFLLEMLFGYLSRRQAIV